MLRSEFADEKRKGTPSATSRLQLPIMEPGKEQNPQMSAIVHHSFFFALPAFPSRSLTAVPSALELGTLTSLRLPCRSSYQTTSTLDACRVSRGLSTAAQPPLAQRPLPQVLPHRRLRRRLRQPAQRLPRLPPPARVAAVATAPVYLRGPLPWPTPKASRSRIMGICGLLRVGTRMRLRADPPGEYQAVLRVFFRSKFVFVDSAWTNDGACADAAAAAHPAVRTPSSRFFNGF